MQIRMLDTGCQHYPVYEVLDQLWACQDGALSHPRNDEVLYFYSPPPSISVANGVQLISHWKIVKLYGPNYYIFKSSQLAHKRLKSID